jgi:peptidoglycan/LPS O-acetylase OafA/YrhL
VIGNTALRSGDVVSSAGVPTSPSQDLQTSTPSESESATPMRHLAGLDGVRAIAILIVVAYHTLQNVPRPTFAQNLLLHVAAQGWVGVDLFFVLSGFLITGILLDTRDRDHPFRTFYSRRVLRILPVYVAYLLFSLFLGSRLGGMHTDEVAQLHRNQGWFWSYTVNILIALRSWKASGFSMTHLWSLSVEEQFYVLWPVVVLWTSPPTVRRVAIGCVIAAELFRLIFILAGVGAQVNFFLLPTRMDTLAAGAFLACAFRDARLWTRVLTARRPVLIVSAAILASVMMYRHTIATQEPLEQLLAFPAIVGLASVVVCSACVSTGWLSNGILRFIAKISYGMYVWHIMILRHVFESALLPDSASPQLMWFYYAKILVAAIAGTIVIATLSWYMIEQPFLRLKRFAPYA